MSDDLFDLGPIPWKSKRYYICKCNIGLWYSLQTMMIRITEDRDVTIDEWKDAVLAYPFSTEGCLCKMCRYRRWYGPSI
jgi:hypothetical protein